MTNYYGFIKNLSSILALYSTLQKGTVFKWTDDCESVFQLAKNHFKSDTVLTHFDSKLPLILNTNARPYGVGAYFHIVTLTQRNKFYSLHCECYQTLKNNTLKLIRRRML